jgi:hypothetical protein
MPGSATEISTARRIVRVRGKLDGPSIEIRHAQDMDETNWWVVDDPATVIGSALTKARAAMGDVIVARVDVKSQAVVGVHRLERRTPFPRAWSTSDGRPRLSDAFRTAAEALAPAHRWTDQRGGYTAVFITVVCRDGRAIDSRDEWLCLRDWRYANHFRDGFEGDVYVVTPHGWAGVVDRRAGHEPRIAGMERRLRAV